MGSLCEFFCNEKLNAENFFSRGAGLRKPSVRWNQFGTIRGPIVKDRIFFADYRGPRSPSAQTWRAGVPSAAMRAGNFGEICTAGFAANGATTSSSSCGIHMSRSGATAPAVRLAWVRPVQQHRCLHQPWNPGSFSAAASRQPS